MRKLALIACAWVAFVVMVALSTTLGIVLFVPYVIGCLGQSILGWCFTLVVLHLYPTRAGQVHVWWMLLMRRRYGRRHVVPIRVDIGKATIHVVPGLLNNCTYIVVDRSEEGPLRCCVVDPGDADATLDALAMLREQHYDAHETGQSATVVDALVGDDAGRPITTTASPELLLVVTHVLVTHKHWDHQYGVRKVVAAEAPNTCQAYDKQPRRFAKPTIEVVAGERETGVLGATYLAPAGDIIAVGSTLRLEVVPSPCHTIGHIMFAVLSVRDDVVALFTGDTLFCGSCGAHFEGTSDDMAANFRRIYHRCPDATLLFPGHDYTSTLFQYFGGHGSLPRAPHQVAALCHALQAMRDARTTAGRRYPSYSAPNCYTTRTSRACTTPPTSSPTPGAS